MLFLCTLFLCTGLFFRGDAVASPSYERMKTLVWKHTIRFIYEDNGMMDQYRENYGTYSFGRIADFENLKDSAGEKRFYTSVQDSIAAKESEGEKVKIEREVEAIILGLKNNRQSNLAKLAKVDSLQHTLHRLIRDEYQQAQEQPASNTGEIVEQPDISSLNNWMVIGLLILLLGSVGLAFWRMMKITWWVGEEMTNLRQYVEFNTSISSDSDSQSYHQQLTTIQKEVKNIQEQLSQLQALIERTSTSPEEMPPAENLLMSSFEDVSLKDRQPVTESRPALFYAKKPNNNLFKQETLTTTARHDSIYRIQEDADGMATFTINPEKKVQDYALQNGGEMFLNEACEIQYENNRPVRITTEAPGKLVKEGKHWHIQEKARVTLR